MMLGAPTRGSESGSMHEVLAGMETRGVPTA
jgi:hypothetical protein